MYERDSHNLEYLLSLWPVAESLARQTGVGDLITLSRTSRDLRAILHGSIPSSDESRECSRLVRYLEPAIGRHQTRHWTHLKSLAPMNCTNTVHTKGKVTKPCVFCSNPICDACIVRDSFKRGSQDTFKNRLRYFCKDCWETSNLTKCHRYFGRPAEHNGFSDPSDTSFDEAKHFCWCTLKDDGWICIECKNQQGSTVIINSAQEVGKSSPVACVGLNCANKIDISSPLKDRYRVCLWCEKPARRYWSSEDRYLSNLKTRRARVDEASARKSEIEDYNRQRWRTMRMTRSEMRGTDDNNEDDKLEFVRHLDTVNYRGLGIPDFAVPSPEDVYNSKNGIWRYSRDFLLQFQRVISSSKSLRGAHPDLEACREMTKCGGLQDCRTNRAFRAHSVSSRRSADFLNVSRRSLDEFNEIQVQLWNDVLSDDRFATLDDIVRHLHGTYDIRMSSTALAHIWADRLQRFMPAITSEIDTGHLPQGCGVAREAEIPAYTPYDTNQYHDPAHHHADELDTNELIRPRTIQDSNNLLSLHSNRDEIDMARADTSDEFDTTEAAEEATMLERAQMATFEVGQTLSKQKEVEADQEAVWQAINHDCSSPSDYNHRTSVGSSCTRDSRDSEDHYDSHDEMADLISSFGKPLTTRL